MVVIKLLGYLAWQLSATAFVYTVFLSRASMIPRRRFLLSWIVVLPVSALLGFSSPAAPWIVGGFVAVVSGLGSLIIWQGLSMVNWPMRKKLSFSSLAIGILVAVLAVTLAAIPWFYTDSDVPVVATVVVLAVFAVIGVRRLRFVNLTNSGI